MVFDENQLGAGGSYSTNKVDFLVKVLPGVTGDPAPHFI